MDFEKLEEKFPWDISKDIAIYRNRAKVYIMTISDNITCLIKSSIYVFAFIRKWLYKESHWQALRIEQKKTFPAKKSVFLVFKEAYRALKLWTEELSTIVNGI